MTPFVITQVNARVYRFRQPQNAAEWQQVKDKGITDIVKLNAPDEGPAGFSDGYAATLGMNVHPLTIVPRGDGPILSQIEGVFEEPDPNIVSQADTLMCNELLIIGVHCTWGYDRTGFETARERVLCENWNPEAAHEEWHRLALYIPYGDRIPSPGLEEAWRKFVEQRKRGKP